MNVFKNPKRALSLFILLLNILQVNAQSVFFFKDTVFEVHQLKFKLESGFRKDGVVKLKVLLTNLSENPLLLNSGDFTAKVVGREVAALLRKPLVIAPKEVVRVKLVFDGTGSLTKDPLTLSLKNISFASTVVNTHPKTLLLVKPKSMVEDNTLHVKVVEVIPKSSKYFVRISVEYTGTKLLLIDYSKAQLLKSKKGDFKNIARGPTSYFIKNDPFQLMLLDFLCPDCYDREITPDLDLSQVFSECDVKTFSGTDFKLTAVNESDLHETKKEKDEGIKEIE